MLKKFMAILAAITLTISSFGGVSYAAETNEVKVGDTISVSSLEDLKEGTYALDASLSCYVSAMGGVEFGASLLSDATMNVAEDGAAAVTLRFTTSTVSIKGITVDTYMDANGLTQYYNGSSWVNASYTTGDNGYVDTMTFPITKVEDTYQLALMVGSSMMSTQFGGADSKYPATLTVNWSNVKVEDLVKAQYTVSVAANDDNAGTVTGGTTVEEGTEVTVKATAKDGYIFKNWTENGASVSTDAEYTFTASANRSLTAVFEAVKAEDDKNNSTDNDKNDNKNDSTGNDKNENVDSDQNDNENGEMISVSALSELKAGTYGLSSKLSCYVSAMGGVEFGEALLSNATMNVAEDGTATVTLKFTTSTVNIFGVVANTYISAEGLIQYYNGSAWVDASYTTDANGNVSTMTFPITKVEDAYQLALMVGSDVMGTQFGGADSKYNAVLTVDWEKVTVGELADTEDKKEESDNGASNNGSSNTTNGSSNTTNNGLTNTSNSTSTTNKNTTTTTSTSPKGTVISVNSLSGLEAGTYGLSASLSCHVNAMGGVEFGNSLLSSAVLNVAEDGTASITLTFKTSSVTIYGVTANTYVSGEGKVQYWNGSAWVNASYTTDAYGYVSTMTFPITEISNTYKLALMVGSEVMGTQFGGDGSNYDAILTVNWNKVTVGGSGSTSPVTGDTAPILPIAAGMVLSAAIVGFVLYNQKKEQM